MTKWTFKVYVFSCDDIWQKIDTIYLKFIYCNRVSAK